MITTAHRPRESERGQAVPEFALIALAFFTLLFAVIQFGVLLGGHIGFTNAVRETARYASTLPQATTTQVETELQTRYLPRAVPGYRSANFDAAATMVEYCSYTNPDHNAVTHPSYSVKVRITAVYKHALFVPLVDIIIDAIDGASDKKLTASVTEEMRVENPPMTTNGGLSACP